MRIQDCVLLGTITKTHGVDGKLILNTEFNLDTKDFREPIFIEFDGLLVPFFLKSADLKRNDQYIVELELVSSMDEATDIVGRTVYLAKDDLVLQQHFDLSQLEGIVIIDQKLGEIGPCVRIDTIAGNYLLAVDTTNDEVLIPFVEDFIVEFIPEENYILLNLPDGLLEINE